MVQSTLHPGAMQLAKDLPSTAGWRARCAVSDSSSHICVKMLVAKICAFSGGNDDSPRAGLQTAFTSAVNHCQRPTVPVHVLCVLAAVPGTQHSHLPRLSHRRLVPQPNRSQRSRLPGTKSGFAADK